MTIFSSNRRDVLKLMAGTAMLPLMAAAMPAKAQDVALRAIVISDLHSAYERIGQLLAAIETRIAADKAPHIILLNGDLFELGNAVATRSAGEIEWTFLAALAKLAPTVINIGNHESDIDNDLANFVSRAQALGITVLSNIIDKRSGNPYAPSSAAVKAGEREVIVAGLATNAINTYPKATREMLDIPQPVEWAKANLPEIVKADAIHIVLSHAGVVADRDILPVLPDGTLLVGGHDHLNFVHEEGATRYVHTGSWCTSMTVATIAGPGKAAAIETFTIDLDAPASPALKTLIEQTLEKHLTAEEREVVGKAAKAMTVDEAGRHVAHLIATKTGADVGFIGHTSFGAGLPAGDIRRYDFNASLRFDGKLMVTEVDSETLVQILKRCNQDSNIPLAARTGDYLYAMPEKPEKKGRYKLVCNDWSATNQKSYFGRSDLAFIEVPDVKLKQTVLGGLS
ncbi:metallophosphoesterase [Agrobacterium pusense]|uniref:metallophosphoesterase n=1 Tax=Agrobacterium pusense TaxID=648995 RepID=UPI001C6E0B1E|nr:metallophosphoesterase [Agrobacterium pusense]MBW9068232.1 bifunctional metallophosphatase/5'-nucleotidase [Agrobacterium pusense]MBW9081822.1 bifunctional metallophosphatase/5'-nucleotidase [Agrobacterium pusense]MBW9122852.1 bifunctional metallophosphatase/5'-nucleotidase [Agrobacterium pusense]MBW9136932.1 bifunctional metallophosphatase/5'-nucleotidase [Agrobacterium pusense]